MTFFSSFASLFSMFLFAEWVGALEKFKWISNGVLTSSLSLYERMADLYYDSKICECVCLCVCFIFYFLCWGDLVSVQIGMLPLTTALAYPSSVYGKLNAGLSIGHKA